MCRNFATWAAIPTLENNYLHRGLPESSLTGQTTILCKGFPNSTFCKGYIIHPDIIHYIVKRSTVLLYSYKLSPSPLTSYRRSCRSSTCGCQAEKGCIEGSEGAQGVITASTLTRYNLIAVGHAIAVRANKQMAMM